MELKIVHDVQGDVKDPVVEVSRTNQPRALPQRLLQLLVPFLALCFFTFSAVSIYTVWFLGRSRALTVVRNSLLPSKTEEVRNLDQWTMKFQSNVMVHNMSDNELFSLATSVSQVKRNSSERVPKIAFMFLTKGPLPLAPLWERFFKGHEGLYSVYIHSSPSYRTDFTPWSVFYKRQIPSQVSEWGEMSICDAERRLLANALLDISNEWFVLLSESCIPLYNFTMIYSYILGSKYSFVGAFDDPGQHGRGRYNDSMLPEVKITEWRKGSQWFEINRELAVYIVKDTRFYPKFAEFCRPECYVDEHYFATMLTIQAANLLANRSITWVDWSRGGAHPGTFGSADITEEFLKRVYEGHSCFYNDKPSSVCYLFARKFSPSALEALFLIAPEFLGF